MGNGAGAAASAHNGAAIDRHEAVFRVNFAPVRGFEQFVGRRTTYRVLGPAPAAYLAAHGLPPGGLLPAPRRAPAPAGASGADAAAEVSPCPPCAFESFCRNSDRPRVAAVEASASPRRLTPRA